MKRIIASVAVVFMSLSVQAQDVHFTMFHVAPTLINPAAAGVFDGTFRAAVNFKTQWGSISNPYNTFSFTGEGAFFKNSGKNAHMGVAVNTYRDVAGTTKFGTTKVNLSLSGIVYLNDLNTASIGITGGWAQKSMNPGALQWDSQFNGQAYDPMLSSNESFAYGSDSYVDFAAGAMWAYGTAASNLASFDKVKAQIGFAYHHLSRPELESQFGGAEKLYSKIVFHANLHYASGYSKLGLRPRLTAFFQGPSREINIGMMFRYLVQEGAKYTGNRKGFAISAGGYYRIGDAISPSIEIEYAGFSLGYSYDLNTSGLRAASKGRGGSEIYLKFQNPNPFFRFSRRPSIR